MVANLLTALMFYLPFVLTIVFGLFATTIGILAIFSGTVLVLLLAGYGLYALLRDVGILEHGIQGAKRLWLYISEDIQRNIEQSFVLRNIEKLPDKPALYLCHPHGLFGYSWLLHFLYRIHTWPNEAVRPKLAIHSIFFRIPLVRDILEQCHCIEAKEDVIQSYLRKGMSVALVTGGIEEMLYNGDTTVKLVLQKRKGYARIAKSCGVPIVPLFTVGENDLFPNETFWLWRSFTSLIHKWFHIQIPLPSWSSMKRWSTILQKPLDKPLETFVLGVLDTQEKSEEEIRRNCEQMYTAFFHEQKIKATLYR